MTSANRALFLLDSLAVGGSELKTVRVANGLSKSGLMVDVAYLNAPDTLLAMLSNDVGRVYLERRGKFSWRALRILERHVREWGVRRIIAVNLYPLLYASALRFVMGNAAPAIVATVNTTEFQTRKAMMQMAVYAPLLRRAQRVIFGCRYQQELWTARYGLANTRCSVIYNGVDSERFSPVAMPASPGRAAFQIDAGAFVVGTVGNLRPEKRQQDLIEVVRRLRHRGSDVVAVVVGDGPKADALKRCAREFDVEGQVRFVGALADVRPVLAIMDVFVLTSASETFSNAALEAMAMGKPVLLSDVGGAREMVEEGVNGRVYPAADIEALAGQVADLADARSSAETMGANARRIAVEKFAFDKVIEQYRMVCDA